MGTSIKISLLSSGTVSWGLGVILGASIKYKDFNTVSGLGFRIAGRGS